MRDDQTLHDRAADDRTLLGRYVGEGSQEAFDALVERYSDLVFGVCRRRTGHRELAEDAAQAVFLLLCRQAPRLITHPTLAGWLYSTADKIALDTVRRERRRAIKEEKAGQTAERVHDRRESMAIYLEDAMAKLSPAERDAIALRFLLGCSLAETGQALKVTEDAARMRVQRALGKLRRELANFGVLVSLEELPHAFPKTPSPDGLSDVLRTLPRPLPKPPIGVLHIMAPITAVTFTGLVGLLFVRSAPHGPPTGPYVAAKRPTPLPAPQTVSKSVNSDSLGLGRPGELNAEQSVNLVIHSLVGECSYERQFSGFGLKPTHDFPGKTRVVFDVTKKTLAVNVLGGEDATAYSLGWQVDPKAGTLILAKDFEDPNADTAFHFVSGAIKDGQAILHFELHQHDAANNSASGPLTVTIGKYRREFDWQAQTSVHGAKPTKGEMKFIFTRAQTNP